jgi:PGF-CTERM protein
MTVCPTMAPSPAIADGVVYIGSDNGNVYAIGNAGQSAISIPGFEVVFAVIGLAIVAFIVSKKR